MTRRHGIALLVLLWPLAAAANEMKEAAEAALGNAQVFTDYSLETADEILAPEVNTVLPQSSMDAAALEEAGMLKATDEESVEGATYDVLGNYQQDSTFAPSDGALNNADAVELDPEEIIERGTFDASGGQCTVTTFEDAPEFTRTCDVVRQTRTETCRQMPDIVFVYTVGAVLRTLDEAVFGVQFSWPGASCTPTNADQNILGSCVGETDPRAYGFVAGSETGTFSISHRIEWSSECSGVVDPAICVQGESICTGTPISWTSDPLTVTEPCSELTTEFVCPSDQYANDCQIFEQNPSCRLVDASCFSTDADGICGASENTYTCGEGQTRSHIDAQCENINVCVAGVCDAVEQEPNDEIPQALAGIGLLNSMAADWNQQQLVDDGCVPGTAETELDPACFGMDDLDYFASEVIGCRKAILAVFNCCRDSGWALGVFTSCRDSEYVLAAAMEAERTVYIRTRCSEKLLFICVEKTREHCVFNGRFAREVSLQGQRQLYGGFVCRGLTHEEFAQIDFSQIDLTPLFGDLIGNVEDLDAEALEARIRNNALLNAPQVRNTSE